jgi:hypothetical protein
MATPSPVAVAIRLDHRPPYAMFELVEVSVPHLRLRGPLMLELGEHVALRLTRDGRHLDVDGQVSAIDRGPGHAEPVTTITLDDAAGSAVQSMAAR